MSRTSQPDKKPIEQYDNKDAAIGKVGYEINFNRYFYKYQLPRSLPVIEADIRTLDKEIMGMLREVAG